MNENNERRGGRTDNTPSSAKSLQSCLTLCDPRDSSPPGSPSLGFFSKNTGVGCHFLLQCMKVESESEVAQSCLTPGNSYQAPLSMGFSRQEYWSGLPFPSPGYLPNPGIEPWSPALQADSLPSEAPGKSLLHITAPKNSLVFSKMIGHLYSF